MIDISKMMMVMMTPISMTHPMKILVFCGGGIIIFWFHFQSLQICTNNKIHFYNLTSCANNIPTKKNKALGSVQSLNP